MMKRKDDKKRWVWPSALQVFCWGLTIALVSLSLIMAVTTGWTLGQASGMSAVFALVGAVAVGVKAIVPAVTFGRGHVLYGCLGLAVVVPAYFLTVTAGHEFVTSRVLMTLNKTDADNTAYLAARDRVEAIRSELKLITEARSGAAIQAAIEGHRQHSRWGSTKGCTDATVPESFQYCQDYAALNGALAVAEKRERLKSELDERLVALQTTPSSAGAEHGVPPAAGVVALIGMEFDSFVAFYAFLVILLIEVGDGLLPMLMTGAAKPAARREIKAAKARADVVHYFEEAEQPERQRRATEKQSQIAEVQSYLQRFAEPDEHCDVKASQFHAHYAACAKAEGRVPMSPQRFGAIMSRDLGIRKVKRSSQHYCGYRLRKIETGAPQLRAVG